MPTAIGHPRATTVRDRVQRPELQISGDTVVDTALDILRSSGAEPTPCRSGRQPPAPATSTPGRSWTTTATSSACSPSGLRCPAQVRTGIRRAPGASRSCKPCPRLCHPVPLPTPPHHRHVLRTPGCRTEVHGPGDHLRTPDEPSRPPPPTPSRPSATQPCADVGSRPSGSGTTSSAGARRRPARPGQPVARAALRRQDVLHQGRHRDEAEERRLQGHHHPRPRPQRDPHRPDHRPPGHRHRLTRPLPAGGRVASGSAGFREARATGVGRCARAGRYDTARPPGGGRPGRVPRGRDEPRLAETTIRPTAVRGAKARGSPADRRRRGTGPAAARSTRTRSAGSSRTLRGG